jgi:hypothetical protein
MSDTPSAAAMEDFVVGILKVQDNAARRGALNFWTIYDRPTDYPHGIIARRHELPTGGKPTPTNHMLVADLEFLRDCFREAGLVCICRQENDDVKIIETWI